MGGYKPRPSGGLGLSDVVVLGGTFIRVPPSKTRGTQRRYVNRICPPDGYEQGLGYAFSCCSAVARCCDMGSFEGGGA